QAGLARASSTLVGSPLERTAARERPAGVAPASRAWRARILLLDDGREDGERKSRTPHLLGAHPLATGLGPSADSLSMRNRQIPRDGFEPPLPGPEPGVLPLDERGVRETRVLRGLPPIG